jgi:heme exporter protein A
LLEGEGLAAFRGERLVLRDVALTVPPGGALLLTGPNGAGKSTLLRLLAGLVRAAAGSLRLEGQDALADPVGHGARVAYLGHLDGLKPGLTATENLRLFGGPEPVRAALAGAELTPLADLPARLLSAGQKRRLALARLGLRPARLWLLDEPTLGLDTASVTRLGATFARLRAAGGMIVAATHVALPLPDAATLALG